MHVSVVNLKSLARKTMSCERVHKIGKLFWIEVFDRFRVLCLFYDFDYW